MIMIKTTLMINTFLLTSFVFSIWTSNRVVTFSVHSHLKPCLLLGLDTQKGGKNKTFWHKKSKIQRSDRVTVEAWRCHWKAPGRIQFSCKQRTCSPIKKRSLGAFLTVGQSQILKGAHTALTEHLPTQWGSYQLKKQYVHIKSFKTFYWHLNTSINSWHLHFDEINPSSVTSLLPLRSSSPTVCSSLWPHTWATTSRRSCTRRSTSTCRPSQPCSPRNTDETRPHCFFVFI